MRRSFYKRRFLFIPFGLAALLAVISLAVMALWNYLLPGLLHVGVITFWQAMGIFVLCKILFGFGKGGRHFGGAPWMRGRMLERFKNMTPEEKERFKEKWNQHCGGRRGWGNHGGNHPFETEWGNAAAEATKSTE